MNRNHSILSLTAVLGVLASPLCGALVLNDPFD